MADTAIHPMQDVLGLDGSNRMNLPGVGHGYWEWRFGWEQVKPVHAQRLVALGGVVWAVMGVCRDADSESLQVVSNQFLLKYSWRN